MNKTRMTILSLTALALLIGPAVVQDADAGVKVNVTLRTPNARVHVGNTPQGYYWGYTDRQHPIVIRGHHRVTRRDRQIATRLARYTGVPSRDMLRLRRQGFRWMEIGRWLYLRPPVVRAAMNQHSWKRFLREERRLAKYGRGKRKERRVVYSDEDIYEAYKERFRDDD